MSTNTVYKNTVSTETAPKGANNWEIIAPPTKTVPIKGAKKTEKAPIKGATIKTDTAPIKAAANKSKTAPIKAAANKSKTAPIKAAANKSDTVPIKGAKKTETKTKKTQCAMCLHWSDRFDAVQLEKEFPECMRCVAEKTAIECVLCKESKGSDAFSPVAIKQVNPICATCWTGIEWLGTCSGCGNEKQRCSNAEKQKGCFAVCINCELTKVMLFEKASLVDLNNALWSAKTQYVKAVYAVKAVKDAKSVVGAESAESNDLKHEKEILQNPLHKNAKVLIETLNALKPSDLAKSQIRSVLKVLLDGKKLDRVHLNLVQNHWIGGCVCMFGEIDPMTIFGTDVCVCKCERSTTKIIVSPSAPLKKKTATPEESKVQQPVQPQPIVLPLPKLLEDVKGLRLVRKRVNRQLKDAETKESRDALKKRVLKLNAEIKATEALVAQARKEKKRGAKSRSGDKPKYEPGGSLPESKVIVVPTPERPQAPQVPYVHEGTAFPPLDALEPIKDSEYPILPSEPTWVDDDETPAKQPGRIEFLPVPMPPLFPRKKKTNEDEKSAAEKQRFESLLEALNAREDTTVFRFEVINTKFGRFGALVLVEHVMCHPQKDESVVMRRFVVTHFVDHDGFVVETKRNILEVKILEKTKPIVQQMTQVAELTPSEKIEVAEFVKEQGEASYVDPDADIDDKIVAIAADAADADDYVVEDLDDESDYEDDDSFQVKDSWDDDGSESLEDLVANLANSK
jgi:hypothetical protein